MFLHIIKYAVCMCLGPPYMYTWYCLSHLLRVVFLLFPVYNSEDILMVYLYGLVFSNWHYSERYMCCTRIVYVATIYEYYPFQLQWKILKYLFVALLIGKNSWNSKKGNVYPHLLHTPFQKLFWILWLVKELCACKRHFSYKKPPISGVNHH